MTDFETKVEWPRFRAFAFASGLAASILFVVLGVATRLQMFGDGSIFSYAVAAQDAWAFHWHNISGRLFTYLYAYVLPEQIVALTGDARAGIAAYGTLFFAAPLFGLLLTFAADRTSHRTLFTYACLSTVCLDPLVYGAPTEMWMAHSLFWPALTACLCAPLDRRGAAAVGLLMLAFMLTHEGAVVLAISILTGLAVRGWRDPRFLRACAAFIIAMLVWTAVKLSIQPDAYIAAVLDAAAFRFIDIHNLAQPAFLTLVAALAAYAAVLAISRALQIDRPHLCAALVCAAALILFWIWFDRWLLTEARYNLRTVLLMAIPVLGFIATLQSMTPDEWKRSLFPFIRSWLEAVRRLANPRALTGALALPLLVHTVETGKFLIAWTEYKSAIRALASGPATDPALGGPLFVSAQRIPADLNRLAWNSTTPFLSVLVVPDLAPTRLVVDPAAGYFWLSCKTARESEATSRAVPETARHLIRIHACLHRPD
jgi:hypothetical protein